MFLVDVNFLADDMFGRGLNVHSLVEFIFDSIMEKVFDDDIFVGVLIIL